MYILKNSKKIFSQPGMNLCWGEYLHPQNIETTINSLREDGYKFFADLAMSLGN